jgi:hypothetical protein
VSDIITYETELAALGTEDFGLIVTTSGVDMRHKSSTPGTPASPSASERLVRDIRRVTRKHYSAEDKIRIVLDGLRGEAPVTKLCRREGGRLCIVGHTHGGTGTAGTKSVALVAAIRTFTDTMNLEYGTDWGSWSKSASKTVVYSKTTDGWAARAEATPCR